MKRVIIVLGVAVALGLSVVAAPRADPQDGQGPRLAHLRGQPGPAGLLQSRRQGQLDRASTSISAARSRRRSSTIRPRSSSRRCPPRTGSSRSIERDRRALAQHDLDAVARRACSISRGVTYYDGQGFMVRKALKVNSALELNGASVCTQTGTTTELNLADYFRANNMKYEVIAFATADETIKAYESRPLRRVHHRRVAALCREAQARATPTTT